MKFLITSLLLITSYLLYAQPASSYLIRRNGSNQAVSSDLPSCYGNCGTSCDYGNITYFFRDPSVINTAGVVDVYPYTINAAKADGTYTVTYMSRVEDYSSNWDGSCNYNVNEYGQSTFTVKIETFQWNSPPGSSCGGSINFGNNISVTTGVSWSVISGGGSFSGTTYNDNGYSGPVTIKASKTYTNGGNADLTHSFTVYTPVSIGTHPSNVAGCPNGAVAFGIAATGSNLTFSWEESYNGGGSWATLSNGGVYSNTSTSTMNISNIAGKASYIYRAKVIGTCNTVYSNNATLSAYGQVGIVTSPPADIYLCNGQGLGLTANATPRTGSIGYEWQYKKISENWSPGWILVANNNSNADPTWEGMQVRFRAYDGCGSVNENYSSVGTIHIYAPTNTTNPGSPSVCAGTNANFSVTASGQGTFTYQWYEDGNALSNNAVYSGATTSSLTVAGPTIAFNGKGYSCKVTGLCNNVTSAPGTLTVANPPAITGDPSTVSTCSGTSASFGVSATGSSLQYQWAYSASGGVGSFNDISGAQSSIYTIAAVAPANAGSYQVKVFNSICSSPVTSSNALLTVQPITSASNPNNVGICPGGNATFTVTGAGSGTVTYQWQKALAATPTVFSNMSGQTFATLTLSNVPVAESGTKYRVIVHSNCGSDVTTTAGTLTVNAIPSAPTAADVARCGTGSLSATATSVAPSPTFNWYANEADITPIYSGATYTVASLGTTATYYVSVVSSCESPKEAVLFTRNNTQNVAMGAALNLCVAQSAYNLENDQLVAEFQ